MPVMAQASTSGPSRGSPGSSAAASSSYPVSDISGNTTTRAAAPKLEPEERRGIWKLNPLADWSEKDIWTYIFKHDLPYHPLHDQGYASIGCAPCTQPGEGRDGRWAGSDKTECGIHVV